MNNEIKISKDQKRFGPLGRTQPGKSIHPQHKATKPWQSGNNSPWAMDMLKLAKKHPGFRPRWVPQHKHEQKLMQGWVFANGEHYGVDRKILGEPTRQGNRLVRRELTLMEIPEDRALARAEYHENKILQRERSQSHELRQATRQAGQELGESKELMTGNIETK